MFTYSQSTGIVWNPDGTILCQGYSGHKAGKNNPEMEGVLNRGPIPSGSWLIDGAYDSPRLGKMVIRLTPINVLPVQRQLNTFRIHGDSARHPGEASRGCIVISKLNRLRMLKSESNILRVVQ